MNTAASVKTKHNKTSCLIFEPMFCTKCNSNMPTGVVDISITVWFNNYKFPLAYLLCALCHSMVEEDENSAAPALLGVRFVKL